MLALTLVSHRGGAFGHSHVLYCILILSNFTWLSIISSVRGERRGVGVGGVFKVQAPQQRAAIL